MSCIFCKIASKEIPVNMIYEDDHVCAFHDINPVAPVHVLVIPKEHIARVDAPGAEKTAAHIFSAIQHLVVSLGIGEEGFRLVTNAGSHGGQTVNHLHFHLLGGRQFTWPPG